MHFRREKQRSFLVLEEVIRAISEDLMIEYGTVLTSFAFRYKQVLAYCDFNRLLTGGKLGAVIQEGLSHFLLNSVLFLKTPQIAILEYRKSQLKDS